MSHPAEHVHRSIMINRINLNKNGINKDVLLSNNNSSLMDDLVPHASNRAATLPASSVHLGTDRKLLGGVG